MALRGPVLRLIDANANRAREALRVLEDYARFVLDHETLSGDLKRLRHALTAATHTVLPDAIAHRDTPGDVGTTIKTDTEQSRPDPAAVVTAAGKRLGEALRSLEEYLKIDHPSSAAAVEHCRYAFYDIERRLLLSLRPGGGRLAKARLYVLITASACRADWLATAEAALRGGADVLQLREKDLESGELLRRAERLVALCRQHGALSIINDRPDIAALSGADGMHVGQGDLSVHEARRILGTEKIVGVSTHALQDAKRARSDGADYIGAGPVYRSPTKPRDISPGLPYLRDLAAAGTDAITPVFAIAGITPDRLPEVIAAGCHRVAVTSAVTGAQDPEAACRAMKAALGQIGAA